ncbi:uncharacterized protein CIMG_08303 [Coccidioides immitis RS]|uniref:Nascent polypeptide-associated complex subunit alpha-like UBA domain-containing protein n=2 Tax=Coccidioides immitis TaxID=5501 RepID=A0A0E1RW14_COCIM|nr:uncharacterized protein CIMG_08303 [Coccidioides immitis RS]EAS29557.1 hypothetical protein CIMG_08303 [Coccidioides immitis RS]KMU84211.1 hypothetical protein CIHG_01997 [Coccidioides immitis H538.4]
MAEPLPSATQAAKADSASTAPDDLPANAEDRAAVVALSSLNTTAAATEDAQTGVALPSKADQEALGKAMSRLEALASATGKAGGSAAAATGASKKDTTPAGKKEEEKVVKKPAVKVKAEDVNMLVEQLDLAKPKAIELLKTHENDPIRALRAFIMPPTSAA